MFWLVGALIFNEMSRFKSTLCKIFRPKRKVTIEGSVMTCSAVHGP